MVTYQQGLENNLKKKTDQKKQITYQENLNKQINQIFFKKKGTKNILLHTSRTWENNFKKNQYQKKRITYQMNLRESKIRDKKMSWKKNKHTILLAVIALIVVLFVAFIFASVVFLICFCWAIQLVLTSADDHGSWWHHCGDGPDALG